jgi:hypothetical protein
MFARIPGTFGAASALWIACASGERAGTGPLPAAATAIVAPAAIAASAPTITDSRRRVEEVRRNPFTP